MRIAYTKAKLAARIRQLGRKISKDYAGRTLDLVVVLDNGYMFGADLMRCISVPVVCHFVRAEMRDIESNGHARREILFSWPPRLRGQGCRGRGRDFEYGRAPGFSDAADRGKPAEIAAPGRSVR